MAQNPEERIIVFDNLVSSHPEIIGKKGPNIKMETQVEPFVNPNAQGDLYRPQSLKDVTMRANAAADNFIKQFACTEI